MYSGFQLQYVNMKKFVQMKKKSFCFINVKRSTPDCPSCSTVEKKTPIDMEQRDQQKEVLVMFLEDGEKLLGQLCKFTIKHLVKLQVKQQ